MKIVLIGRYNESEILTGPEKFGKRILFYLYQGGNKVVFIDYFFKNSDVSLIQRLFGKKIISKEPYVLKLGLIRIIHYLLKERPNIFHIVTLEVFQIPFLLLKNFLRLKIVTTYHGVLKNEIISSGTYKSNYLRKVRVLMLEKLAIKKSSVNVFVSNLLLNEFRKNYHDLVNSSDVIYNGLDEIFFTKSDQKKFTIPFKFVFYNGTSSNIERGLDKLLKLLNTISDLPIELFIIGMEEGSMIFKENFCVYKIKLMSGENLKEFLNDKHFVIKGTSFDSFSIFCLESMSQGLIPIVHRNVGIAEIIEQSESGFIYNLEDYQSFNEIFDFIENNQGDLIKISSNSKALAKQFSWQKVVKSYLEIYDRCLKEK